MNRLRVNRSICLLGLFVAATAQASDTIFLDGLDSRVCPEGRVLTSNLMYFNAPGSPSVDDADVTQWDSIWGRLSPDDPVTPWPGQNNNMVVVTRTIGTGYIAAQFTVPAGARYRGDFYLSTYFTNPSLDATISPRCGDFVDVAPGCSVRGAGSGSSLFNWYSVPPGRCEIPEGKYYLNIRLTDPADPSSGCTDERCTIALLSTWNSL